MNSNFQTLCLTFLCFPEKKNSTVKRQLTFLWGA